MPILNLPLSRSVRSGAWGLILASAGLALASQSPASWRLGSMVLLLIGGVGLWRRYLRRRPVALRLDRDGGIGCTCADGHADEVGQLRLGVLHPALISASLRLVDGRCCDLFVPRGALSAVEHWQLRRALLAFRSRDRDRPEGAAHDYDSARRGT